MRQGTISDYIREQPAALRAVFGQVPAQVRLFARALVETPPRALYLIGSGTSRHALLAAQAGLVSALACEVAICGPLEFQRRSGIPGASAIVLSQSGMSATSVDALCHAQATGLRTLAVTAEDRSPLAERAEERVILPIGPESVGPKTKGYTASVAALLCLRAEVEAARGTRQVDWPDAFTTACERLDEPFSRWIAEGEDLARAYHRARQIMVVGHGRHLATALEGSLKIVEMSGIPSCGFDTEEAMHGRFHALGADDLLILLVGDPEGVGLARGVTAVLDGLGIPSYLLRLQETLESAVGTVAAELDVISLIVPLQSLAHELALQRGVNPNLMPYPGLSANLGIKLSASGSSDR